MVLLWYFQIGTVGGNLMIKHEHNEFPSDIFLLLETVGAQLIIREFAFINFGSDLILEETIFDTKLRF